jgi:hypothetical protein
MATRTLPALRGRWLIGAANQPAARRITARYQALVLLGSRRSGGLLAVSVPAARAAGVAAELKRAGLLRYSEPEVQLQRDGRARAFAAGLPPDPLSGFQ